MTKTTRRHDRLAAGNGLVSELGLRLAKFCAENPEARVILESHGLFTWGDTPKECYETTVDVIGSEAIDRSERQTKGVAFGGAVTQVLPALF